MDKKLPWWEHHNAEIDEIKSEITKMYEKYAPDKIGGLPDMFKKYEGREKKLLDNVRVKYEVKGKITAIYEKFAPEKLHGLPMMFKKYAGKEIKFLENVKEKYVKPTMMLHNKNDKNNMTMNDKYNFNIEECDIKLVEEAKQRRKRRGGKRKCDIQVFVRVRPMTPFELQSGEKELKWGAPNENSISITDVVLNAREKKWEYKGFKNVLLPEDNNEIVFYESIHPQLSRVLGGETAACFCYGHTGAGKTHTILGYGSETGIYKQAAYQLCEDLEKLSDQYGIALYLGMRVAEIHNKRVFDLMNNRKECFIREDLEGNIHIRGKAILHDDGRVTVSPLSSKYATSRDDVDRMLAEALRLRVTGSSSLHDQSSRSHALLELEIVTDGVIRCRDEIIEAEGRLVPALKAAEKDRSYKVHKILLECKEAVKRTRQNLKHLFERSPNVVGGMLVFIDLAGAEHGSDFDKRNSSNSTFGSEIMRQSKEERREGIEINKSLLALKECIRAQSKNASRTPYRQSTLTMVLRRYLKAVDASTVMIANISAGDSHTLRTRNTLRYAQGVVEIIE